MEAEEVFSEIMTHMKCTELVTIGKKESYKDGMVKRENYYLTYLTNGLKCSLTFTKVHDD